MKRFAFIALHAPGWPVQQQYRLLGVSSSGYYAWQKRVPLRPPNQRLPSGKWRPSASSLLMPDVMVSAGYGPNCGAKATPWAGSDCAAGLVPAGLRALCTRASTRPPRTTQADPQAIAAANRLATWPAATAPNRIWVGDITYLALALALATGQWAYLACWRDTFSRRVGG